VAELQAKKEARVNIIFEKHTRTLTYEEWILHERQKHTGCLGTILSDIEAQSGVPIDSLPSAPKESEVWATDCAICLTEFDKSEQVCELPCDHIFHDACIRDWFMKAKSPACPLCRNILHSGLSAEEITAPVANQEGEVPPPDIEGELPQPLAVVVTASPLPMHNTNTVA
jgi:hypothetical protein